MSTRSIKSCLLFSFAGVAIAFASATMAQTTGATNSTPTKQMQKEQRKLDRKAHRAKKNAELGALEKNGYQPGGDQIDYPQNLQNAQRKVDAQKAAGSNPASAP